MSELRKPMTLLPKGFEDLLPPDAEKEFRAIAQLMACFCAFGYQRVKPPLAEFEESLLAPGPGAASAEKTFRVMDPQSDKMLALRSDITAQIARISGVRMADVPRPLRLTYANDALRTRASQQRTLRQFCQVGCELIGGHDVDDVVEAAVIALKGLDDIGVQNISIDFAIPRVFNAVFQAAGGVRDDEIDALRADLSGPASDVLKRLEALDLPADAKASVDTLGRVFHGVQDAVDALGLQGIGFTIDPLETKGFEYHDGVAFTLFSKNVYGELGRGGRYKMHHGDCDGAGTDCTEYAAGFTLYMDTVRKTLPVFTEEKRVFVPEDLSWGALKDLQEQGWITVRGNPGDTTLLSTCTHVYKDGTVQEI